MQQIARWHGYWVSRDGIIYRKNTKHGLIPLSAFEDKTGYKRVKVSIDENGTLRNRYVHVIVFEAFSGWKRTKGYQIHHIDRNTHNNSYDNLLMLDIATHRALHQLSPKEQEKIVSRELGYTFSLEEETEE